MNLQRVDLLLKDARIVSLQRDYGEDYGIDNSFFLVAINNAIASIQRYLVTEMAEPFASYKDIPTVANQSVYDLPSDIFAHNLVYEVIYSGSGNERDFSEPLGTMYTRDYITAGRPENYLVDGNKLYIDSINVSAGGKLRVRYEKNLDQLDIRRAQAESIVVTPGADFDFVTDLMVNLNSAVDTDALSSAEYVCICDAYGKIEARNIKVLGYDSSLGKFTLLPSTGSPIEKGSVINAGSYITVGADTSTHSILTRIFLDYFISYIKNEVFEHLSEDDQDITIPKLDRILAKCAEIYSQMPSGRMSIPELRREL